MSAIEALYIFDEHNAPLLEHTYTGRPPPGSILLPLYLSHPSPRPSLIYLPNTNPPTLLYSIIHDQLLFLAPCSSDVEPLQVLEFLHRVADVLEDFLGAPLLASKIEAHYDVVAQLLSEMVDGGVISVTEPNALRDVVEAPGLLKSLLGGVGLPSTTPSSLGVSSSSGPFSLGSRGNSGMVGMGSGMGGGRTSPGTPPGMAATTNHNVPWRKANVRHTSNELYVDVVETLDVIIAPSGRPLSAIANGTIAFTAKVSGVPELFMQLGCPGGIANTISLPAFHPCVRLKRWQERPGDLSFVPPDGRFVLAGYEVDLLGDAALDAFSTTSKLSTPKLNIPASTSIRTSLGPTGADFEVRLTLNPRYAGSKSSHSSTSLTTSSSSSHRGPTLGGGGGLGGGLGAGRGLNLSNLASGTSQGTTAAPTIEEIVVHVPLPASVKNVADLRVGKGAGDAGYAPGDRAIEWRISSREVAVLMSQDRGTGTGVVVSLYGTVVGADDPSSDDMDAGPESISPANAYNYNDDEEVDEKAGYQSPAPALEEKRNEDADAKRIKQNKVLMPSCATVSFSVKGWLPSGIKVESLSVDQKRSKGLGAGVQPYKGVKYLGVSRRGVECRA